jgi:hypothetical protein
VPSPLLFLLLVQLLEEAQRVHIAFNGEFGPHTVTPRLLTSEVWVVASWLVGSSSRGGAGVDCLLAAVLAGSNGCSIGACVRQHRPSSSLQRSPLPCLLSTPLPCHFFRHARPWLLQFLSKLVNLQGIVTRCTLVRPKIVKSVHYCPATGQFQSREYRDVTANAGAPTSTAYPTK